jgi:hypothetical protein
MFAYDDVPGTHAVFAAAGKFILDPADSMIDYDPQAGFQTGYARTQTGYDSRHVRSAPVRHLKIKAGNASHDPYVEMVQGTCLDIDKHLALTGDRIGDIIVLENIRTAMLVETEGFHILRPF